MTVIASSDISGRNIGTMGQSKLFKGRFLKFCLALFVISVFINSVNPSLSFSDSVDYLYDENGRLITVIDENGNYVIYEYDAVGNLLSIISSTGLQTPQITSIIPSSASQGDIVNIEISGDNLTGSEIVTDNSGITISNVRTSKMFITATFSISYQAVTGISTVTVKTPIGFATTEFIVNSTPPSIISISPTSGPVSKLVTITGTGFSTTISENVVSFNGALAEVISADTTSILTSVPAGATSGPVTVTVNGLTSNGIYFDVTTSQTPPLISLVNPNVGSVEGNGLITIEGSGFTSDTAVYIGGKYPLSLQIVDTSTILLKTPPGSEGSVDVLVTNINGDAFLPGGFTYLSGTNESILRINPPLGMINIPINTNVSVLFTRPVERTTVTTSSFAVIENDTNIPVSGNISFDFGDSAIFFTPLSPLNQNTTYRISISQDIISIDGVPLDAPFTGFFTTGEVSDTFAPNVTTSPADGETVPYNSSIIFTFSEPVNPVTINKYTISVTNNGEPKNGEIIISEENSVVTFSPYSPFLPNTPVNVTLSSKITDIAGNSIVGNSGPGTDLVFSFTAATNADYMPPRVLYINPSPGAAGVNPNTSISVIFNEPINPVTVNSASFFVSSEGIELQGTILFSNRNTTATFIPDQTLPLFKVIDITLTTDIMDVSGNALTSLFTSTFTTASSVDNFQPMVVSVSPYDGQDDVPLNARVQVVFSERLDPLTVRGGTFYARYRQQGLLTTLAGDITLSNDGMVALLTPDSPLLPNTKYTIYVTQGITDVAGNQLYQQYTGDFTTGETLADSTGPSVLSISPVSGMTDVPVNAHVVVEFTEPVAGTTVNNETVVVSAGGIAVPGEITLEQGRKVLRWRRANLELLEASTLYEVTLTTGITDLAGNTLQGQYGSFFTTGTQEDTIAPEIVSVSPAHFTYDVSLDTSIIITFSEPISPASINGSFSVSVTGSGSDGPVEGTLSLSEDRMTVTFTPTYPLFADQWHYIKLNYCLYSWNTNSIEDIAGNEMECVTSIFRTVLAAGTDTSSLPTGATVTANPSTLYADGINTATVMITNINRSGILVPNGTRLAVTVEPAYKSNSAGGTILGGLPAPDPRFRIYTTLGGEITLTYQSPELSELLPGQSAYAYIQVATVDAEDNPITLEGTGKITLVRDNTADVTVNPVDLLVDTGSYADVNVIVKDNTGNPVTPGTEVGITAEPIYDSESLGGMIEGGVVGTDPRVKVFSTISGGVVTTTYTPPVLSPDQSGKAVIQAVSIDEAGQVSGLLGSATMNLSTVSGYTTPQPEVLTVSPSNGSTEIPLNAVITATFSEALDPATVNSTNFSVKKGSSAVAGTLSLSADEKVVTFTPTNLLSPNSSYSIYIGTGIQSATGNPLLSYKYSTFSTGMSEDTVAPFVKLVNPPDGTTGAGINAVITVQFSEQMNAASINETSFTVSQGGVNIPGRIDISSTNTRAIFTPDQLLAGGMQYTVTVAGTVTDLAGNALAAAFVSTFITAPGEDTIRPEVVSVNPANGSTDVPDNTTVTITFSETMNPVSINSSTFYLSGPEGTVRGVITLGSGNTTATFTPEYPLFAGALYRVYVTKGTEDIAGNYLTTRFSSSFWAAETPNLEIEPTSATIMINPQSLFADGTISTTVIVSNINNSGTAVPNGTIIAVTADPAFVQNSVGGTISGASIGISPDTRFTLFETYGAKVEFSYTPPDLTGIQPDTLAYGTIQVASVDADNRPVRLVASGTAMLFHIRSATITADPNTFNIGQQGTSTITVIVKDRDGNIVPDGTKVGLTVAPIFVSSTMGGAIEGGVTSSVDSRVQIFTTTGGQFTATYITPSQTSSAGDETIQAVTVNNDGYVTGLITTGTITFIE